LIRIITPELAGTELKYNFRGQHLTISFDNNSYAVSNKMFKVVSNKNFGFNSTKDQLSYFHGSSPDACLQIKSIIPLTITIQNWDSDKMEWSQTLGKSTSRPLIYVVHLLKPNKDYLFSVNGKPVKKTRSNLNGDLVYKLYCKRCFGTNYYH